MTASRVIRVEPMYGVGLWHNVVISIIQGHMDVAGVRGLAEAYDTLIDTHPNGIAAITVLRGNLSVGSKETNAEAQRLMAQIRSSMLHIAVVIENRGFVAQLLRSVIRTLNAVGRGTRLSLATNIDEAARVTVPHVVSRDGSSLQHLQKGLLQAVDTVANALPAVDPRKN